MFAAFMPSFSIVPYSVGELRFVQETSSVERREKGRQQGAESSMILQGWQVPFCMWNVCGSSLVWFIRAWGDNSYLRTLLCWIPMGFSFTHSHSGPSVWQVLRESWGWTAMSHAQPQRLALQQSLKDRRVTHPGHLASPKTNQPGTVRPP